MKIVVEGSPVSVNAAYRHTGRRTYMTPKGKAWKALVASAVRDVWTDAPTKRAQWRVSISYWFRNRLSDVGNFDKLILDALEGVVYENDREVVDLHLLKRVDGKNPRVELTISRA